MAAVLDTFEKLEGKPVKFSDLAKRRNWYRDLHICLGRVRALRVKDGILIEETNTEPDKDGREKEKKTGRVYMPWEKNHKGRCGPPETTCDAARGRKAGCSADRARQLLKMSEARVVKA